jgi:hypothetical protein
MATNLMITQCTYTGKSPVPINECVITEKELWKLYNAVTETGPLVVSIKIVKANKELYGESVYIKLSKTSNVCVQIDVYSNWHRRKDYIEFDGNSIVRVNDSFVRNDKEEATKQFLVEYNKEFVHFSCTSQCDDPLRELIHKMSSDLDAEAEIKI